MRWPTSVGTAARASAANLAGHAQGGALRCPYHAWTYELDGSLRKAPWLPPGTDASTLGLVSLPVEVCHGLIFVSFTDDPLDFGGVEASVRRRVRPVRVA